MILESQVRALDAGIQQLDAQITSSREPRVNAAFRKSWREYTSRWAVQRDSWLGAGDITRKFGFSEDVFNQYKTAYQKWFSDYQSRISGAAKTPQSAPQPAPTSPGFLANLFSGSLNTIIVVGLIVGGLYLINTRRNEK